MRHIYQNTIQDGLGNIVENAEITVYLADTTTKATIYTTASGGTADSDSVVTSDSVGRFFFYIDDSDYMPSQLFDLSIALSGYDTETWDDIRIIPDEPYFYYCDATATNQGAATTEGDRSLKDLIDTIGTSKQATIKLPHSGTGNTTTYVLGTAETVPSNIYLDIEPGALIQPAAGITLTVESPEHIIASPRQQIFDSSLTGNISFDEAGVVFADWWGIKPDWTAVGSMGSDTANVTAFNQMLDDCGNYYTYVFPGANYGFASELTIDVFGKFIGRGSAGVQTHIVEAATWHFDGTAGIKLETFNIVFEGIQIELDQNGDGIGSLDAAAGTFGKTGVRTDPSQTISSLHMNHCRLKGWDTGLLFFRTASAYCGSYHHIRETEFRANVIGLAAIYTTQLTFTNCYFRDNTLHGQYIEQSYVNFIGGLSEKNGTKNIGDANPEYYGFWSNGYLLNMQTSFQNHYFEQVAIYAEAGNVILKDCCMSTWGARNIYGKGGLMIDYVNKSTNLVPIDMYSEWTEDEFTTTDEGGYFKLVYDGADTAITKYVTIDVDPGMLASDVIGGFVTIYFKNVASQTGNNFEIYPIVKLTDDTGVTDSSNIALCAPMTEWDFTDTSGYQALQFHYRPTDSLTGTYISEIEFKIRMDGDDFSSATGNPIEVHMLPPAFHLFSNMSTLQRDSASGATMTPGTGLSGATGFVHKYSVERSGDIITTRIYMDLTGLNSGGVAGDIIGKDGGTANCHFGQITAAKNGTIYAGWIDVGEAPAGGDPDIDLYSADEATGAENAPITGLTNDTQLCNSGDLVVGTRVNLTAFPAADQYMYMVVGTQTVADYTAGMIIITLLGVAL